MVCHGILPFHIVGDSIERRFLTLALGVPAAIPAAIHVGLAPGGDGRGITVALNAERTEGMCRCMSWPLRQRLTCHKSECRASCATDLMWHLSEAYFVLLQFSTSTKHRRRDPLALSEKLRTSPRSVDNQTSKTGANHPMICEIVTASHTGIWNTESLGCWGCGFASKKVVF